jgi:hypothetical protein
MMQVTDDKKVEKCVVSAGEVSALKFLNEQLNDQKRQLAEMGSEEVAVIGDTKVAEVKLKLGKTKSILTQVMDCIHQSMKERMKGEGGEEEAKTEKMSLEFIDDSGKSIKGYEVEGRLVNKDEEEGGPLFGEEGGYLLYGQDYQPQHEDWAALLKRHHPNHFDQFDFDLKFKKEKLDIALAQPILSPREPPNF